MDPLSQAALGAVAAASVAKRPALGWAALTGGLAAVLADADVFIRSDADPLLNVEYHRHFSHSLAFIPIGGAIAAALLWPFLRRKLSLSALYGLATLGYATAGLLDACTSYGTHLLWPFSNDRTAWNIISIVDPVFTGLLLIGLVFAISKHRPTVARLALAGAICYLGLGILQRERALAAQQELAASRGHDEIEMATAKPTIGNLILWRSLYRYEDTFHVDAARVGFLSEPRIYPGSSVDAPELGSLQPDQPEGNVLAEDLRRFHHFSDGYIARSPEDPQLIVDLRYSMLPHRLDPLWAIRINPGDPMRRAVFETFRSVDAESRDTLWRMLRGQSIEPDPVP